ncbi:hypothetical protein C8024_15310 [Sphingopyxis sp. BSNA05]|uniref:hypothetical protein n=1 Tax=Sphingopyxis sp. BSNA05 TaxID=1236614 RepID=UPI0015631430|nr:hypothetical protein [Sphingopyxis sp. BSNA05]NRD90534.1 hypothetical protein [Sphingopyxis sp. BSNA05]
MAALGRRERRHDQLASKNTPIIAQFGPLAWIGAGLLAGLIVAIILAIMQWANRQVKHSDYLTALTAQPTQINPLAIAFENRIIKISDLELPGPMLHSKRDLQAANL